MMGAFMDTTCRKCGKRFGWVGNSVDRPPCPKCGGMVDIVALKADDEEINRFRDLLLKRKSEREGNII